MTEIFKELLKKVDEYVVENSDGETDTFTLVEQYCERFGIPDDLYEKICQEIWKQEALDAGIPLSVIEGKTKLSDHFSPEYITQQCGKK